MKAAGRILIVIGLCIVHGSAFDEWFQRGIGCGLILAGLEWNYKKQGDK